MSDAGFKLTYHDSGDRKKDPFLIFYDVVFDVQSKNHDTKTYIIKKEKIFFSLINAGWVISGILYIFFNINQINLLYLSNNEASCGHIYVNDTHREKLCFT